MNETKTYQELIGPDTETKLGFNQAQLTSLLDDMYDVIIVLDDDPTGTQTVHDIPVLTQWTIETLESELQLGTDFFFILTNSRSFSQSDARALGLEIAFNIKEATTKHGLKALIISRSDSTLRGHYPLEINILKDVFAFENGVQFIVPAFFEGGRYTVDDVHYVKEGEQLIPAGQTPFAMDKVFGYESSDLKEWVIEKYKGDIDDSTIHSMTIGDMNDAAESEIISRINQFKPNDICILNATHYDHLRKALWCIASSEIYPYYRSAASLVAALAGQQAKLLDASDFKLNKNKGGVTVLGSYVLKSTKQLNHVLNNLEIELFQVDVKKLLNSISPEPKDVATQIDEAVEKGKDVILFTSRELVSVGESKKNLDIGATVSKYLTDIVSLLQVQPKYIIGKGGITSSDIATESLEIKRAIIRGQILPGVPVWQTTSDSKFPSIPYIVFPGNVGSDSSLTEVIQKF